LCRKVRLSSERRVPVESYKRIIIDDIRQHIPSGEITLEVPPDRKLGDLALPCFPFAPLLRKSPAAIAADLKDRIGEHEFIDRTEVVGGYLNFYLNRAVVIRNAVNAICSEGRSYGSSGRGRGKRALVEHTSINPNASPHVGRARNALIGDSIVRMLRFEGYEVEVHYFVNDVGKQIAMLVLGAEGRGSVTFDDLLKVYVDINRRVEEDPELEKKVFALLSRLESGDEEAIRDFRRVVDICIEGQTRILGELGIRYDVFKYESDYVAEGVTGEILERLQATGKLEKDTDGRFVLNLEDYDLPSRAPYVVLTRADGTSLYPLRDIAYTIDKVATGCDPNIVVLGEDQKLYFQQVRAALDILGYAAPVSIHYSFVLLPDGKMSTRQGTVVLLEDFMKEAVAKATEEMAKRHGQADEAIAKAVAYGAVKYAILKVANERNVAFDWESALSFEGDTGPYLQYCHARINSIIRRAGGDLPTGADFSALTEDIEFELAKELAQFPTAVSQAVDEFSPHIVAGATYRVARAFSTFYSQCPVLNADDEKMRDARLLLCASVKQVIGNGMSLLGIDPVESM
jgi:arginyl-tRNA synthetase